MQCSPASSAACLSDRRFAFAFVLARSALLRLELPRRGLPAAAEHCPCPSSSGLSFSWADSLLATSATSREDGKPMVVGPIGRRTYTNQDWIPWDSLEVY
jgi:hypothetical protein